MIISMYRNEYFFNNLWVLFYRIVWLYEKDFIKELSK